MKQACLREVDNLDEKTFKHTNILKSRMSSIHVVIAEIEKRVPGWRGTPCIQNTVPVCVL